MSHWMAMERWSQRYFSERFGDTSVTVWLQEKRGQVGRRDTMLIREFLDRLERQIPGDDADIYCGNGSIEKIDPTLLSDIENPVIGVPGDRGNLWIGRALHQSHLHYDAHPGCLCGVRGRKTVQLWAPAEITSDSALNVRSNLQDLPKPSMVLILDPGDVLMIPFFWWHLVVSDSDSISVNFWYYPIETVQRLKFDENDVYWPIVRREILESIAKSGLKWELMKEQTLKSFYLKAHQGGHVSDDLFNLHKHQIVQIVEVFLSSKK